MDDITIFLIIAAAVITGGFAIARLGKPHPIAQQAVNAMSPQISDLEQRVNYLRHKSDTQQQTIQALEKRVAELEKRLPPAP